MTETKRKRAQRVSAASASSTYRKVRPRAVQETSKPKAFSIASAMTWLEEARKLFFNLATLAGFGLLAWTIVDTVRADQAIIEPITLPPVMNTVGYTEEVAAMRLRDAMQAIKDGADKDKQGPKILPSSRELDIAAPGTGVSLSSITKLVGRLIGGYQNRIAGEFVCPADPCKPADVTLRLRIFGETTEQIGLDAIGKRSFDEYLELAGEQVMRAIAPYTLASSLPQSRQQDAIGIAVDIANSPKHPDKANAENLVGSLKYEAGDIDDSIYWFNRAVESNPKLANAHFNLGLALSSKPGESTRSSEEFQQAVNLDPNPADVLKS